MRIIYILNITKCCFYSSMFIQQQSHYKLHYISLELQKENVNKIILIYSGEP